MILTTPITINGTAVTELKLSVVADCYETPIKQCRVHFIGGYHPLVLWNGADYDANQNWTVDTIAARINELAEQIPPLFIKPVTK